MAQGSRCPGRTVSLTKWGSGRCGHWRGGELGVQEEAGLWSRPRQSLLPSHWAHQARGCVSKPAAPHPVVDRVVSLAILGGVSSSGRRLLGELGLLGHPLGKLKYKMACGLPPAPRGHPVPRCCPFSLLWSDIPCQAPGSGTWSLLLTSRTGGHSGPAAVVGKPLPGGERAGWASDCPDPPWPTGVGFPWGRPSCTQLAKGGGQQLGKAVPSWLLRKGHRRPLQPQPGWMGLPPPLQPPGCQLLLSLPGKEEGLAACLCTQHLTTQAFRTSFFP